MNLKMYSLALLISAVPHFALAGPAISLNRGDFIIAERVTDFGDTVLKVKLSKSGKAKFKKLNRQALNKDVHTEVAGVTSDFTLREPIRGDGIEIGPYSADDATRVVAAINNR